MKSCILDALSILSAVSIFILSGLIISRLNYKLRFGRILVPITLGVIVFILIQTQTPKVITIVQCHESTKTLACLK